MATNYLCLIVAIKRSRRPLMPNIGDLHRKGQEGRGGEGKRREGGGGTEEEEWRRRNGGGGVSIVY